MGWDWKSLQALILRAPLCSANNDDDDDEGWVDWINRCDKYQQASSEER